jgi:hypothetical protein
MKKNDCKFFLFWNSNFVGIFIIDLFDIFYISKLLF